MPVTALSVVIPVYNAEGSLEPLVDRLLPVLRSVAGQFEILLVDDCSRDESWRVAKGLAEKHAGLVRAIAFMRNYGQHNALLCGIRAARFELVVTMDDDLQHPPEELPKLLAKLAEGFDVVYGTPSRQPHGALRGLASVVSKLAFQTVLGAKTARIVSAYRLFRTGLRDAFADFGGAWLSIDVLLTWGTTRFAAVEIEHDPRRIGRSNYGFRRLFVNAMNMVTGFSVLPLQVASLLGFFLTLFGAGLLVFVVGRYFLHGTIVPGFTFLASIIVIFSGAQLFTLGMIGEYLARMHFRMMDRPTYVVKERTGDDRADGR